MSEASYLPVARFAGLECRVQRRRGVIIEFCRPILRTDHDRYSVELGDTRARH